MLLKNDVFKTAQKLPKYFGYFVKKIVNSKFKKKLFNLISLFVRYDMTWRTKGRGR